MVNILLGAVILVGGLAAFAGLAFMFHKPFEWVTENWLDIAFWLLVFWLVGGFARLAFQ